MAPVQGRHAQSEKCNMFTCCVVVSLFMFHYLINNSPRHLFSLAFSIYSKYTARSPRPRAGGGREGEAGRVSEDRDNNNYNHIDTITSNIHILVTRLRRISLLRLSLLRLLDPNSGKFPTDMRILPLNIKILLESNPPKSIILVWRLAVDGPQP